VRVVGGAARGRRLRGPKGDEVRPTSDRVREALFSRLGSRVEGARVLDLYCGSGALAVEAISRGAALAVLVDRSSSAIAVARENLARTGAGERARAVRSAVEKFLDSPSDQQFDLVFLDPPYDTPVDSVNAAVARLVSGCFLVPGAMVVAERSRDAGEPSVLGPLPVTDVRRYGDTRLLFAVAD
jgi:16S rRNA (guanine966-N2)-methyltransferase